MSRVSVGPAWTAAVVVSAALSPGLSVPTGAADLFIAGPLGAVWKGDSATGQFQLFGDLCLGPINALAITNGTVYAGDETGAILRWDLATGVLLGVFDLGAGVSSMVADGGDLLVSELAGTIRRVDADTGVILSTLTSPVPVEAMLIDGNDLFISGPLGGIWKGDAHAGGFFYFGCACAGSVQGMAMDDTTIYACDDFGQFESYDLATGMLTNEGFLPFATTAMVTAGQELLISDPDGNVHRFDPLTWVVSDTMPSPINILAMSMAPAILGDLDGDGIVGVPDLLTLLAAWGPCVSCANCPADLDGDCAVSVPDLLTLLANWG